MSLLTSPVEIYWISGSPFAWRVLLTAELQQQNAQPSTAHYR